MMTMVLLLIINLTSCQYKWTCLSKYQTSVNPIPLRGKRLSIQNSCQQTSALSFALYFSAFTHHLSGHI